MAGITLPCLECLECKGLGAMLGRDVPPVLHPIHAEPVEDAPLSALKGDYAALPLSAREIQVVACLARGRANKEMARDLRISDQTIKNHLTSIYRKLSVCDRTQAVVAAIQRGIITV